jgi:hypothetical protein
LKSTGTGILLAGSIMFDTVIYFEPIKLRNIFYSDMIIADNLPFTVIVLTGLP